MNKADADAVFGQIMAINTFLENFPMSIFDMMNQRVYNTAFDFIIDVLNACGVNTSQIIGTLMEKIYGIDGLAGSTIDGMLDRVRFGNIEVNTQNKFMESVEWSIKGILMGLFTSIFTCESLPILPNSSFDYDGYVSQNNEPLMDDGISNILSGISIPVSLIDITGMLNISPTSYEGNLYYMTDGKDTYYIKSQKTEITKEIIENEEIPAGTKYCKMVNAYDGEFLLVAIYNSGTLTFYLYDSTFSVFETPRIDLKIQVDVLNTLGQITMEKTMCANESQVSFNLSEIGVTKIIGVTINGMAGEGFIAFNDGENKLRYHLYLDKNNSNLGDIEETIEWGTSKIDKQTLAYYTASADTVETIVKQTQNTIYAYEPIEKKKIDEIENAKENKDKKPIVRVSEIPNSPGEESPYYIVHFTGENPNTLYRSYDMNAFIWYVLNRGVRQTQIGKNLMMWDSRVYASNNSITRNSNSDWNNWYNSKAVEGEEFKFQSDPLHKFMFPIIQLEPQGSDKQNILVHIPAQKYFKPKLRKKYENGDSVSQILRELEINSTVYKFDWDYLKNIRILNPKILLSKLLMNLFGLVRPIPNNFNLIENMVRGKLSSAIKNIIEASDMEIEDCYNKFSNEDFDELLNEMLLERYSSTYKKDGDARQFDISDYVNSIDAINPNSTSTGTTTSLTKLITDVSVTDGEEWSSEINLEHKFDSNMLNRLIYAIVMPIIESIFTPQVLLLIAINFEILGVVKLEDFQGQGWNGVIKFFFYKILGLTKSIVVFIKDKIVEILLDLFYEYIKPYIEKYLQILLKEKLENWLKLLKEALECIQMFGIIRFNSVVNGEIEDVDYADIVNPLPIPESSLEC